MPLVGVWDTYNGYIADRRKGGATLGEIGEEVGVSRERVRQILVQHYGTSERGKPVQFFATVELAQLTGMATTTIARYRQVGIIKPVNASRQYPLYNMDALKIVLARRRCQICGKPIPPHRSAYCSPKCLEEGTYKSHSRGSWRAFKRKIGQPITPSIGYKSKEGSSCQS